MTLFWCNPSYSYYKQHIKMTNSELKSSIDTTYKQTSLKD